MEALKKLLDPPPTDAPATDAPATDAPATDAPATDAPATDAPATDAPAAAGKKSAPFHPIRDFVKAVVKDVAEAVGA